MTTEPKIGNELPNIALPDHRGRVRRLSGIRTGTPVRFEVVEHPDTGPTARSVQTGTTDAAIPQRRSLEDAGTRRHGI